MKNKEIITLVLQQAKENFENLLDGRERETIDRCVPMGHGIFLLAGSLISVLYRGSADSNLMWESGLAREFTDWAIIKMRNWAISPLSTDELLKRLEVYLKEKFHDDRI